MKHTLEATNDGRAVFHLADNQHIDIQMRDDGMLEVYASDARIMVLPHTANVVYIRTEPMWAEKTYVDVAERALERGMLLPESADKLRTLAERIVNIARGRKP